MLVEQVEYVAQSSRAGGACDAPAHGNEEVTSMQYQPSSARALTAPERLAASLVPATDLSPNGMAGCIVWTGCTLKSGYGNIGVNGKSRPTHLYAWEQANGPVPAGLELDHLCRRRNCANLDHLEPVTTRENVLRGVGPSAINARKTHCIYGHAFTPENTYRDRRGKRECRTCRAARRVAA